MLPEPVLRQPRTKRIAQEVEPLVLSRASAVRVLAVHDAGLVRMKLQTDLRHPSGNGIQDLAGLGRAVRYCIICVSLEGDGRELPSHPPVERVMQEQIGQQG